MIMELDGVTHVVEVLGVQVTHTAGVKVVWDLEIAVDGLQVLSCKVLTGTMVLLLETVIILITLMVVVVAQVAQEDLADLEDPEECRPFWGLPS